MCVRIFFIWTIFQNNLHRNYYIQWCPCEPGLFQVQSWFESALLWPSQHKNDSFKKLRKWHRDFFFFSLWKPNTQTTDSTNDNFTSKVIYFSSRNTTKNSRKVITILFEHVCSNLFVQLVFLRANWWCDDVDVWEVMWFPCVITCYVCVH